MLLDDDVAWPGGKALVELPLRCAFLEGLVGLVAMLDENDRGFGITGGGHKGDRIAYKFRCPVNGWATHSVERRALNVDDE